MIDQIEIENFKCFRHKKIGDCKRVNIIVGDNGSGKTALLEGLFLALASSSEMALRFRQNRGLDSSFRGSSRGISTAILSDYFYRLDTSKPASVTLKGSGVENRSVKIQAFNDTPTGFLFEWVDAAGRKLTVVPNIGAQGVVFPETGEGPMDFYYFASNQTYSSIDTAERFSILSRARRQGGIVSVFTNEYSWLEDFGIEVAAGSAALYATVNGLNDKLQVANVSGGINRVTAVLVTIASRPRSVVLVDEIENGLYYKHHENYWRAILKYARDYDGQLFLTTHSAEWLHALPAAAGNEIDDVALWRVERGDGDQPEIFQFGGTTLRDGLELGAEVRASAD